VTHFQSQPPTINPTHRLIRRAMRAILPTTVLLKMANSHLETKKRPAIVRAEPEETICEMPPKKRPKMVLRKVVIRPADFVKSAFKANGVNIEALASETETAFLIPTQDMIAAYKPDTLLAVRQNDLEKLRGMHAAGANLECCNKFGENLISLACRRGYTDIVEFLIKEAKVSLNVRDDYSRTPLHDACWTPEPNFEMLDLLIREVPAHLILPDVRGFTPFDYVREEHWNKWVKFLWERKTMLRPKEPVLKERA
jgi:hypothetical protein